MNENFAPKENRRQLKEYITKKLQKIVLQIFFMNQNDYFQHVVIKL